jgi:hypothetical protein
MFPDQPGQNSSACAARGRPISREGVDLEGPTARLAPVGADTPGLDQVRGIGPLEHLAVAAHESSQGDLQQIHTLGHSSVGG